MKTMTAISDLLPLAANLQPPLFNPSGLLQLIETRDAVYRYPCVCLVLPFNPKMVCNELLASQLNMAFAKVEKRLLQQYPFDVCNLLLFKLKAIVRNVNYNTHKTSLAIFISPVFEKVYYLSMPVEERIWIDQSFEMRALPEAKQTPQQYLVLTLEASRSQVFLGGDDLFYRLLSNKMSNSKADERNLLRPLQRTDQVLEHILNAYQLPLFVMGRQKILQAFAQSTKHVSAIIGYIPVTKLAGTAAQLRKLMATYLINWQQVHQKALQNKLDEARAKNELVAGFPDVWRVAMKGKGRLLLVEKNYEGSIHSYGLEARGCNETQPYHSFSCIKNAIDALIEKLLLTDADVEFVNEGWLKNYGHIALL